MSTDSEEFTCYLCKETFRKVWTDEDSMRDALNYFTPDELADTGVVCDGCWLTMIGSH